MTHQNREDEVTAQALREAVRAGSARLEPTGRIARVLLARAPQDVLSDVARDQAVRTARNAAVDGRLQVVREDLPVARGFSAALRNARTAAGLSAVELADRLSIDVVLLRDAEASARAALDWPAESLADVLEILDIPLHVVRSSVRRPRTRGRSEPTLYQAAASLAADGPPFSHPTLADTARILRERGRGHLLVSS
jgi:ribosome-binding protein aMBF1 (putative translation factor)